MVEDLPVKRLGDTKYFSSVNLQVSRDLMDGTGGLPHFLQIISTGRPPSIKDSAYGKIPYEEPNSFLIYLFWGSSL